MGRSLTVLIYLNNVRVCTCIAFVPSKSTIAIPRTHKCVVAEREECARGPRVIQRRFAERWRDCVHGYNTVRRFLMSSLAGFESPALPRVTPRLFPIVMLSTIFFSSLFTSAVLSHHRRDVQAQCPWDQGLSETLQAARSRT